MFGVKEKNSDGKSLNISNFKVDIPKQEPRSNRESTSRLNARVENIVVAIKYRDKKSVNLFSRDINIEGLVHIAEMAVEREAEYVEAHKEEERHFENLITFINIIIKYMPEKNNIIIDILEDFKQRISSGGVREGDIETEITKIIANISRIVNDAPGEAGSSRCDAVPAFPQVAPELWRDRDRAREETPAQFIKRVYGPWIGKGFTRPMLTKLDPVFNTQISKRGSPDEILSLFDARNSKMVGKEEAIQMVMERRRRERDRLREKRAAKGHQN